MNYDQYEQGESLPGKLAVTKTGPIGAVWFGSQGIVLTIIIFCWPALTLILLYKQWWAWLVFPPLQIIWIRVLKQEIRKGKGLPPKG